MILKRTKAFKRGKLHARTLELLKARARTVTLKSISEETGLEEFWLSKFQNETINDPSVNRIETLYEHLSGKSLEV